MAERVNLGLQQTRGIINDINTCWLNSALQCLAQAPHLYDELYNCTQESESHLEIPGGTLTLNGATITLPQIEIELDDSKTLTYWLYRTLRSLASNDASVYYPYRFLQKIASCLPQFIIGEQNDSHEFVRCLLETLRTEKQERYRKAIGHAIKIIKETTPELFPDEDEEQVTNFYCLEASRKFPSVVDNHFRGTLQTSLQCVHCKTVIKRQDDFFDLSVPIAESNCLDCKEIDLEEYKKSEFRHLRFIEFIKQNENQLSDLKSDQSISLLLYFSLLLNKFANNCNMVTNNESGDTTAVENEENEMDDGVFDKDAMELSFDCEENQIESQISESPADEEDQVEEAKTEIDSKFELCSNDDSMEEEEEEAKFFLLAIADKNQIDSKTKLEVCSNDSAMKEEIPEATSTNNHAVSVDDKYIEEVDSSGLQEYEEMPSDENKELFQYVEDFCYLKNCLDNFFGEELLTDDNKVICEACSKQAGGDGEKLLRDTLTQFKISRPPHILILNLKRFNFLNGEIVKNNKRVLFPTILDIAPYCTQELNVEVCDIPLLYSLYAVNEHFGTMERGHYVSYRRLQNDNDEYAYNYTLPGQWIIANDEHIISANESFVTNVKAYILFYKRIF